MKQCNCCKQLKKSFYKDASKTDGLRTICKDCDIEKTRTLDGYISELFKRMKRNSKARNHNAPNFTKKSLKQWLLNKSNFYNIYIYWKQNGYKKDIAPSIDRLNDYKPYSFDNIRVVAWKENMEKAWNDRKNGINNKNNTAVLQFSQDFILLNSFYSLSFASKETKIHSSCIRRCCKNKNYRSGGFFWRYLEDKNGVHLKVGDYVDLSFPFTPTTCQLVVKVRDGKKEIVPDSAFQSIYGENWSKFCEKKF